MPVAMEHALAGVANKKHLKGKHRNAFIYGIMRKTGWKPKREKRLSRYERLIELNSRLDKAMEEPKKRLPGLIGKGLVIGGLGYGGWKGHKIIKYGGGYRKVGGDFINAIKRGFSK